MKMDVLPDHGGTSFAFPVYLLDLNTLKNYGLFITDDKKDISQVL